MAEVKYTLQYLPTFYTDLEEHVMYISHVLKNVQAANYDHSAIVFGKGELLDEILDASEEKDADRIYALFSDYAIEENDELYSEIEFYLDNFPEIDELFTRGCSEFGSHNIGSTE